MSTSEVIRIQIIGVRCCAVGVWFLCEGGTVLVTGRAPLEIAG